VDLSGVCEYVLDLLRYLSNSRVRGGDANEGKIKMVGRECPKG